MIGTFFILKFLFAVSTFVLGVLLNQKVDKDFAAAAKQNKKATAAATGYLLLAICLKNGEAATGFFWGSLALAAYSDQLTKEVRDFCYLPAVFCLIRIIPMNIPDMIIFVLIQWFLFRRFYGEADCLVFCMCAIYMAGENNTRLLDYIILLAVTFLFLTVVQGAKRNINRKGNLKQPVALIPYIAAAMLVL